MKRYILCLLMICLLLCAGFYCADYAEEVLTDTEAMKEEQVQKLNNEPANLKYLQDLGLEPYVSEIPVVMIDTGNQQLIKEELRSCEVSIYDDPSGLNDIQAQPTDVIKAGLKLRGASSYSFDKSQYRMKIYNDNGRGERDYDFLGLGQENEWVFHGPFLDRSLIRNYIMYKLSGQVMEWAPDCAFFELYIDGWYQGVYLAVEPVTVGQDRLRLSKFGLVSGSTSYIAVRDRRGTEDGVIHPYGEVYGYTSNEMSIRYPNPKNLSEPQRKWIERDIAQFEHALFSTAFDDPKKGYAQYIDMDSFAQYFILNELSMNHDAGSLSTFVYKELNGKMKLCVWDFNNAFDNYMFSSISTDTWLLPDNNWFNRLCQDRNFVDCVVKNYRELRNGSLSDENINAVIDEALTILGDAPDRNFTRWGYTLRSHLLAQGDGPNRNPSSFREAVSVLRGIIDKRCSFMDKNIDCLYNNCIN